MFSHFCIWVLSCLELMIPSVVLCGFVLDIVSKKVQEKHQYFQSLVYSVGKWQLKSYYL